LSIKILNIFSNSLQDKDRHGSSITVSPGNILVAITDSSGYVTLIETLSGIALRMFKDYEDAQIGWLTKPSVDQIIYLVLYAPRRGLLQVFDVNVKEPVGSFQVGDSCQLIYTGQGLLSDNLNTDSTGIQHRCFLLDGEGQIKHIVLKKKRAVDRIWSTMASFIN
jgi:hypothetical protein